jgi:hypothetical protein
MAYATDRYTADIMRASDHPEVGCSGRLMQQATRSTVQKLGSAYVDASILRRWT